MDKMLKKLTEMRSQLKDRDEKIAALEASNKEFSLKNQTLSITLIELKNKLKEDKEKETKLQEQLKKFKDENVEIMGRGMKEKETKDEEILMLKEKEKILAHNVTKVKELEDILELNKIEQSEKEEKIRKMMEVKMEKEAEIFRLQTANDTLNENLTSLESTSNETIEGLKTECEKLKEEHLIKIKTLNNSLQLLSNNNNNLQIESDKLKQSEKDLAGKKLLLNEQLEKIQTEMIQLKEERKKKEDNVPKESVFVQTVFDDFRELSESSEPHSTLNQKLHEELQKSKLELIESNRLSSRLQKSENHAAGENDKLKDRIKKMQEENDDLIKSINEMGREIEVHKRNDKRSKASIQSKNQIIQKLVGELRVCQNQNKSGSKTT